MSCCERMRRDTRRDREVPFHVMLRARKFLSFGVN